MKERPSNGPLENLSLQFSRIAMWLPAVIVGIITIDIIYRYVFISSTLWVNETSLWLGGMIYLSSGLYAMHHRSHIRISLIYDMVPRWAKLVFDILSIFCISFFIFWIVWGTYSTAMRKFLSWERLGTVFDPPIPGTNYAVMIILMLFIILQVLSNFIRDWGFPVWIRKTYDVISTGLVVWLCLHIMILAMGWGAHDVSKIPTVWHYAIFIGMGLIMASTVWGLIRDFNTDPEDFVDDDDMGA